jgi:hypothetical protein
VKRRARSRGFSHVSTTLEAAAIMGWFAVAVISEKHLDDAVTARRASETSAQESAHGSAASAKSQPVENAVGEARPQTSVSIGSSDKLGVNDQSLPSLNEIGWTKSKAFNSQQTPLKHAAANAKTNGAFPAARQISCQDEAPSSTKPQIESFRSTLWDTHLKGY